MNDGDADTSGETPGWLGLLLLCSILVASSFLAAYANVQLRVDSVINSDSEHPDSGTRRYFYIGTFLIVFAGLVDIVVIGYLPLLYRACLASLSIPINVIVARLALREELSNRRVLGIFLTFLGCLEGVISSNASSGEVDSSSIDEGQSSTWLLLIPLCLVGVSLALSELTGFIAKSNTSNWALFSITCGTAFLASSSSSFGKNATQTAFKEGSGLLNFIVIVSFAGCILAAILQFLLLSRMLGRFDVSVCIPAYQILASLWLSIISLLVFNEHMNSVFGFIAGFATSAVGIWITASSAPSSEDSCPNKSSAMQLDEDDLSILGDALSPKVHQI